MSKKRVPVVLIIDDDPDIVNLAEIVLTDQGYKVQTALNGRQGMVAAFTSPPDLILMDVNMPGRDGLTLLKDIRSQPDMANLPVIMLTGSSRPEVVSSAIHSKVNDFLLKPFDLDTLVERVTKWLPPPEKDDP